MDLLEIKFEEIYKTHYKTLHYAADNIIRDKDTSNDIVQEVFLKLWGKKDELDRILNLKAYLFKSVVNASITYLEKNKKMTPFSGLKLFTQESTESNFDVKELERKIEIALNKLPPKCKAVFMLSRFEELKNKEIAEVLDISLKTVENQMGIALKKMKDELGPYLSDEQASLIIILILASLIHLY